MDRENFVECVGLRVAPGQEGFVASNVYSLAQSKVEPQCVPLAIYADDEMVGFAMYGLEDDGEVWIHRFMISAYHQGKGFGRASIEALISLIREQTDRDATTIKLSYEPENSPAERLYESLGFRRTGQVVEGEIVSRLARPG